MFEDAWSAAGAVILIICGGALVGRQALGEIRMRRKSAESGKAPAALAVQRSPSLPERPKSQLPILSGEELLRLTGAQGDLERIRTKLGLSPANYEKDVVPLIHRLAEYLQYLPASESHHHAQPGGLLQHTMEVAAHALTLREGYKLPKGATPEEQIRLGSVWSFGILVAALLHDIGKPVADVVIHVYGADIYKPLGTWNGLAGSLVQAAVNSDATHYTVQFPTQHDYKAHQRLPLMLLHALVPQSALQWLASDPQLMGELMAYLEGGEADASKASGLDSTAPASSVLKEIVSGADSRSVAANLAKGTRTRFASAKSVPLIERLMLGLRTLLAEGGLALNRPGAAAFVDPDQQHIWLVAGVAADQTRKLLEAREVRTAGAAGIPTDNTRLFDTWAEYGVLVQPDKAFGKGSVWWVRVELDDWSQVLTVLKFPMDKLYSPGAVRPSPLNGSVIPVDPKSDRRSATDMALELQGQGAVDGQTEPGLEADTRMGEQSDVQSGDESESASHSIGGIAASEGSERSGHIQATAPALGIPVTVHQPLPADPQVPLKANSADDGFLEETETALMASVVPSSPRRAVQALAPGELGSNPPKALYKNNSVIPKPNADRFMAWIQQGLGTGEINYNESDAFVHFVKAGMVIVTPRAFKIYLQSNPFIGEVGAAKDNLRALQNEVQKAGYIERKDKSSFHFYQTQQDDGESGAVLTTYLIPNPQAYIRPVPAPNPLLKPCDAPIKQPKVAT